MLPTIACRLSVVYGSVRVCTYYGRLESWPQCTAAVKPSPSNVVSPLDISERS